MPKQVAGLSARKVETIKTPGLFADGNGLYLQVAASGSKSWILRYLLGGRRRDMGLGSVSIIGLAEARARAQEARRLIAAGVDPIDARKAEVAALAIETAQATTFRQAAERYLAAMRPGWRNEKHASQWQTTLERYAYPVFGAKPAGEVDTDAVMQAIRPLWATKTETASRLRGRIEAILDYAKVSGWRSGENPARWRGHLDQLLPAKGRVAPVKHHRSLPYSAMPAFWPRLQVHDGLSARALEFLVLTVARCSEVTNATWPEIDLDAAIWTIPGSRMKAGVEHRVPLSPPALSLLGKMATVRQNDLVFPGHVKGRPLSGMSLAMVLRRMDVDATPHGFRSSFRTWASEETTFAHEVCEAALAHAEANRVIAAYRRGDFFAKRAELMDAWAMFIQGARSHG